MACRRLLAYFANAVDVSNSFRNVLPAEGFSAHTRHMFAQSQTIYLEITNTLAKYEERDRIRSRINPPLKKGGGTKCAMGRNDSVTSLTPLGAAKDPLIAFRRHPSTGTLLSQAAHYAESMSLLRKAKSPGPTESVEGAKTVSPSNFDGDKDAKTRQYR